MTLPPLTLHELSPRAKRVSALLRQLPRQFPGKMRAARFLLGDTLNARDVSLRDCDENSFGLPHLSEPMALHLVTDGVYEADTRAVILERLTEDALFVDVGANIGLFTIPAARKTRKGGVIAVEASPRMFMYLERNVARNGLTNVQLCNVAASDRAGEQARFYDAPLEKFGMGSLAPQFAGNFTRVPTATLDNVLTADQFARVRVLKMDVEGFEAAVLRGATKLLTQKNPPLVLFEFMDWAESRAGAEGIGSAQKVLCALDFQIWRLDDWRRGKPALETILTQGGEMLVAERVGVGAGSSGPLAERR